MLLLIDLDNTLVDRRAAFKAWAVSRFGASEAGWVIDADRDGYAARDLLAAAIAARYDIDSDEILTELRAGMADRIVLDPALPGALRSATAAGCVPVVVSNGTVAQQEAKLRHTGLDRLVAGWVISEGVGVRKPDRRIFELAAAAVPVGETAAVHIDEHSVRQRGRGRGRPAYGLGRGRTALAGRARRAPHVDRRHLRRGAKSVAAPEFNDDMIHTTPPERAAVFAAITGLGERDLTLPADVSLTPPAAGDHWVTTGEAALSNGVLVYVHGGGFTHRNPPLMNLLASILSRATARPVQVVHYPLAPASPFPAPVESVVTQYRALLDSVPADRIVLFSESSGGTLALSAMSRLEPDERPAGIVAVSPVTDLSLGSPSIDTNAPSDAGVHRQLLEFLVGQYLAGAPAAEASPLFDDLGRMPPLLLAAGSAEALLDDTLRFGEAATAAGVQTQIDVYEGMPHAFSLAMLDGGRVGRLFLDRVTSWVHSVGGR